MAITGSAYSPLIQKVLTDIGQRHDPRHVEAWMLVDRPTLDSLSPAQFRAEVLIAIACIKTRGARDAERLARSYGL